MTFEKTFIEGVFTAHLSPFKDERGSFVRMFCQDEFKVIGMNKHIVQVNHSVNNKKGTFRGFHYQNPPFSETKIIRCVRGEVWDVVIDIRKNAPTSLKHFAIKLTADNDTMIVIPDGMAHGFITLADNSELIYFHTALYAPGFEGAIRYDDPAIGIKLPIRPTVISEKDKSYPLIDDTNFGLII